MVSQPGFESAQGLASMADGVFLFWAQLCERRVQVPEFHGDEDRIVTESLVPLRGVSDDAFTGLFESCEDLSVAADQADAAGEARAASRGRGLSGDCTDKRVLSTKFIYF